jgi:two-component system chemotaxis response regulator CheB
MTPDPSRGRGPAGESRRYRVLVVDDSAAQRGLLAALLDADPDLEVVGTASDGAHAVAVTAQLHPDVITMDLRMPTMDGLEATRQIMQHTPTPIVMVTASLARQDQHVVFEALQAGVLVIVPKPLAGVENRASAQELVRTVKSMAQVRVIRRWAPERLRPPATPPPRPTVRAVSRALEIVAIGASTGGPQVLQEILTHLPASFPLPVVVVQHIAPGFAAGLVDWLRPQCALPIELATSGVRLDRPGIFVAPTGQHLVVRGHALGLTSDPPVSGHRPSATVLLQSVARDYGGAAVGVLLTGMGDDGAVGLRDVKRAGGITIAQDEASSVVFGMPAVAIGLGVVDHVLAPSQMAPLLVDLARRGRGN